MVAEPTAMHPQQISVAICTHNGARFLVEQIASILAQTHLPSEIVLSDDASTDESVQIARDVVAQFNSTRATSPVDLIILRNTVSLGVTKNFESALSACTFDLVAISDQDDVWMPDRLERASVVFENRSSLLLLHGDAELIDEGGMDLETTLFGALEVSREVKEAIHAGHGFEILLRRNVVTGATSMIRRDLLHLAKPFPDSWLHDEWLAVIAAAYDGLDLVDERLIRYRQHRENVVGARRLRLIDKFRRLIEPGAERNRRLLARSLSLADRLSSAGGKIAASRVDSVTRKHEHEVIRSHLSPHRLARMLPVMRGLAAGRYAEFGRGTADAARDLLQPLGEPR
jgi:glycosyltransferase involved in cell wall biosynthesis